MKMLMNRDDLETPPLRSQASVVWLEPTLWTAGEDARRSISPFVESWELHDATCGVWGPPPLDSNHSGKSRYECNTAHTRVSQVISYVRMKLRTNIGFTENLAE